MASSALLRLHPLGQSCWLDNLTREMLDGGELARRVAHEDLRGVTANPAIFHKAIESSDAYDGQIREQARGGASAAAIVEALMVADVQRACDVLAPVHLASEGADGFVSLEVSPHLAHHAPASIEEARRLAAAVDRPNLMIKIPGTEQGLKAIEELLFEGIHVNVTLLFGVPRYEAVADAWMKALERRQRAGLPISGVASVASFFLSRIDVLVDRLLAHRIVEGAAPVWDVDPASLRGKVAVANAKLAHRSLRRMLAGDRWAHLAREGARVQRLLWASTSVKDPAYDPLMYVQPLIGPHTVNTMPEPTIAAFAANGTAARTVDRDVNAAARTMRELRSLGIDIRRIAAQLEDDGIEKFIQPYDRLLALVDARRGA